MITFRAQSRLRREIEQLRPQLFRLAYSWTHNPSLADDLVQEACVKALEKSNQLREHAKMGAWLAKVLVNIHRDHLRRQREFVDVDTVLLTTSIGPQSMAEQNDTTQRVRNAIQELGEEQRKVLTLVDLSDFTYAEVADIMAIPIGTVMSRLCRARRHLKNLLEAQQDLGKQPGLRRIK